MKRVRILPAVCGAVLFALQTFGYEVQTDFNNESLGKYDDTEFKNALSGSSENWDNGFSNGRVSIVSTDRGKSMQVSYPKGAVGPGSGGAQLLVNLLAHDELTLEYKIKFPDGFDYVKGGKLPGLAGGAANSGSDVPDGTDGWSTRFMWREGGALYLYSYHADMEKNYGTYAPCNKILRTGRWYTVSQTVKMNDVGSDNGKIIVKVDGSQKLVIDDYTFRTTNNLRINKLFFSTFFGGSGSDWAPNKDETILFDDFKITDAQGTVILPVDGTLFDDFEDGDTKSLWNSEWYSFNDANNGGASQVALSFPAGYESEKALGASATLEQGTYQYAPYIGIGAYLKADKTNLDISSSSGISFYYKASGTNISEIILRVETPDVAASPKSPYYRVNLQQSATWTPVSFTWDQFSQPSWSEITPMDFDLQNVTKISIQIKGTVGQTATADLMLDKIAFPGLTGVTAVNQPFGNHSSRVGPTAPGVVQKSNMIHFFGVDATDALSIFSLAGKRIAYFPVGSFTSGSASFSPRSLGLGRGAYVARMHSANKVSQMRFVVR